MTAEEDDPIVGFRQMRRDTSVAHRWDALNQRSAQLARYLFKQVTSYMRLLRSLFRLGTALFLLIHIVRERGFPQAILVGAKKSFLAVYVYAAFCYTRFRVTSAALKEIVCIRGNYRPDDRIPRAISNASNVLKKLKQKIPVAKNATKYLSWLRLQ
jgi:hypothetical protein